MPAFVPYTPARLAQDEALARARAFHALLDGRRCVRQFSGEPVPRALLEECVRAAGTAPSGAHKQPWTYVAIGDPATKQIIRDAAEAVERENYAWRMSEEWKADLAPLGTDFVKEHLTRAPWIVIVFQQDFAQKPDGGAGRHYYVMQSVALSVGLFLAACRAAGLSTLVHTPSPMDFLRDLLGRPRNERAFAVIPVGYPAPDCTVPDLRRKTLEEFLVVDPPARPVTFAPGADRQEGEERR